jgi:hypothetical protein
VGLSAEQSFVNTRYRHLGPEAKVLSEPDVHVEFATRQGTNTAFALTALRPAHPRLPNGARVACRHVSVAGSGQGLGGFCSDALPVARARGAGLG